MPTLSAYETRGGAFAGLAEKAGRPLAEIVKLAAENNLRELFDMRTGKLKSVEKRLTPTPQRRNATRRADPRAPLMRIVELWRIRGEWH